MNRNDTQKAIESGKTVLGIEFGSTRIKAVLIGEDHTPIASGSYDWENRYENGIWSYTLDDVWTGLQESYRKLSKEVFENYNTPLQTMGAIGFSAMMHGYMAFDKDGNLLVPFRTWRNTTTAQAAKELTKLFQFNVPHRWSIAHLYQAILNKEPHIKNISYQTTLAGYVHWKLTGQKVLGVGDASGMCPIDSKANDYDASKIELFNDRLEAENIAWKLQDILPKVLTAGDAAGVLTEQGAKLLDPTAQLQTAIPLCPPEGDAGTGMVATNSVAERMGNVSAGTSVFAMIVLEKESLEISLFARAYHEKERSMHISIRRYKTDSAPAIARLVNEQFVALIDKIPGFLAYYLIDTTEGVLASVSIFETKEGAEESNRVAAGWVKEGLSVLLGQAEITAGEVVVNRTR